MASVSGYAFTSDYKTEMAKRSERYEEIKHLADKMSIKRTPAYAHTKCSGELIEDVELSNLDILLLCDRGNTCFGGEVYRYGKTFTASVYTD